MGGGLAGISASMRLAEGGWEVTLLEARASLGGRVFSFRDPQSGLYLDNGQHVIVGACSELIALLDAIGARHLWHLQPRLDVAVYDRAGRRGRLYGVSAPSPLHLLPAFVAYPHLGWWDKVAAVRGLLAIMRTRRGADHLENTTFHDWLRAHGQTDRAISNLWNLLIEGTLNDNIRDVSASMGLMIVQDGLLGGRNTSNVGYPKASLHEALINPARRRLESLGVQILDGRPARRINLDETNAVQGVALVDSHEVRADAYVSAVPFWVLPKMLPASFAGLDACCNLQHLNASPIVNVHLRYDRPVMTEDFCYFLDSPLQWVFNTSRIWGKDDAENGQSLSVSISAAWGIVGRDRDQLGADIASEMRRMYPKARDARLLNCVVVKQPAATFRCTPGAGRFRPGPRTGSPNLFLAGEWTDTGWPSTMESAVISGYNAADAVMSSWGARDARER